jgi:hypothetical protein
LHDDGVAIFGERVLVVGPQSRDIAALDAIPRATMTDGIRQFIEPPVEEDDVQALIVD